MLENNGKYMVHMGINQYPMIEWKIKRKVERIPLCSSEILNKNEFVLVYHIVYHTLIIYYTYDIHET